VIVEVILSVALLLGPPVSEGPAEGPVAPSEGEGESGEPEVVDETAAIVAAASEAVQDRAVLERNNKAVPEFVRHLDALATVEDRLDTCGKAVQAELRMDLATSYLRAAGTCDADDAAGPEQAPPELSYPGECADANDPNSCASQLLERAAEFGDSGPAGAEDPLAQAAGCPHAAESMSVERMFGTCVAEEYALAVERWHESQKPPEQPVEPDRKPIPVPRWGSILGISLGAAAIAGGAALVAIDGKCKGGGSPTGMDPCPNIYNTDAGGAVLISVGALAVLSMGTILTITEIQAKKNKNSGKTAVMRRRMERVAAITGWQAPRLQLRAPRRL
jgi:hypothetical protein